MENSLNLLYINYYAMRVQDLEKLWFEEFFNKAPLSFWISETKKNWVNFGRFINISLWKDEFAESEDMKFYANMREQNKERWIKRIETRYEYWSNYQEAIIKIFKKLFKDKDVVFWELNKENCNLIFERYKN